MLQITDEQFAVLTEIALSTDNLIMLDILDSLPDSGEQEADYKATVNFFYRDALIARCGAILTADVIDSIISNAENGIAVGRSGEQEVQGETKPIDDVALRCLLDDWMCADPMPLSALVTSALAAEAQRRGYDSLATAYHEFRVPATTNQKEG